ncbi:MAG: hydroxymethylbilane synthase [Candidatus Hydrothermarchaeales archaeon]
MKFKIGSRGSKLALAQVDIIINLLKKTQPELEFEKKIIKTRGDKIKDAPLAKIGGKGLFIKEIDEAVLRGEVDFAVHSAKDVPTDLLKGLRIACVPEREEINDVLISKDRIRLDELPRGAVVGTSSLRRKAELLNYRSDLKTKNIRGNVGTRIRKVMEGEYDATIMAKAGLKRLGVTGEITETLPREVFLPSVGQGAIAVISRSDFNAIDLLYKINHRESMASILAERAMLKSLGGGCQVPIGVVSNIDETKIVLSAVVLSPDGKQKVATTMEGTPEKSADIGKRAAVQLLEDGADKILKEVYG